MAFDDLDLEFEDEDEAKKKKSEAVQVDVDLEFSMPDNGMTKSRPHLIRPESPPQNEAPAATPTVAKPAATPVTKIADARAAQVAKKPLAAAVARPLPQAAAPKVVGSSALQADHVEMEGQAILEMRAELKKVQFEAEVKVAVAEYKTELLSELLSDTKLMQHQIEQLLVRINAKHPDMKQEVLLIKKILADFTAKKRK